MQLATRSPAQRETYAASSSGRVVFLDILAALRTLGKVHFNEAYGFRFRHLVHGSDFASHAVEGGFIELTLGIGLLRLVFGTIDDREPPRR